MPTNQTLTIIDPSLSFDDFPEKHFQFKHNLSGHPLFTKDRLLQLAQKLQPVFIEYNSGGADISQDPMTTPYTGLSLEETLINIDACESWVVLKYAEYDPDYQELLVETIRQIVPLEQRRKLGAHQLESYIFISSPRAVTPFHFDDEHNFLLQIRGSKQFHGWTTTGLGKASAEDLERYYLGGHRNIPLREKAETADHIFELKAGDALHVPAHSPHWVQNGDETSISFSVTFRSHPLAQEALIHRLNGRLRKLGLNPRPYGINATLDKTKYQTSRVLKKLFARKR
ncbi:MAG: cupin domain-containing protein [Porticoccus sp.]|nr:cupin domain-containing protein [Porticoccus sp.]